MLLVTKRLMGWVLGILFAVVIVVVVHIVERHLRFRIRRNPGWRSQVAAESVRYEPRTGLRSWPEC